MFLKGHNISGGQQMKINEAFKERLEQHLTEHNSLVLKITREVGIGRLTIVNLFE